MRDELIRELVEEVGPILVGRAPGKIFQLSRASLAIDFRLAEGTYLFVSVEPAAPRLYLISRRVRDLEKQSAATPSPFVLLARKRLSGAILRAVAKDEGDRVVRLRFESRDELGVAHAPSLVAQLTGRTANFFLLDDKGHVVDALRPARGEGQEVGELYRPPAQPGGATAQPGAPPAFTRGDFASLSEAADDYYRRREAARLFDARVSAARARLHKEISQRDKLRRRLEDDVATHGDADEHKRAGDLLLANIQTAERRGNVVTVADYYSEGAPPVEIAIDENSSLQEEAARRFARYGKAKRAAQEITRRLVTIDEELSGLATRRAELEEIAAARDEEALAEFTGEGTSAADESRAGARARKKEKDAQQVPGARRYQSSDGHEILVGRAARDNDHLTFRVARPHDLWLHAADYPGSHVVVRNPTRADVPHRTIVEAAQLAAYFSQAKQDAKVDVHYTARKFLSKPKGGAPGLVRMSSFRTITVEPREAAERV